MPGILQNVIIDASGKNHNLYYTGINSGAHDAVMENTDKNGGPNHLKAWREHRKLSQVELADLVDSTQSQIAHLENGERALSAKWLRKLADALHTTPGHLLDHNPGELPADIVEIWLDANLEQRRQLIDMAHVIVRKHA